MMTTGIEDFAASLPRSRALDGTDLTIERVEPDGGVVVTDGERSARYAPIEGGPLQGALSIKASYVEAGWFSEANVVRLSDGRRDVLYAPEGSD